MNLQVREFFRTDRNQDPHFKQVRFLQEESELGWEEAERCGVPRGWYELSRISLGDRLDFVRDFWLGRLPYHPVATSGIGEFFDKLDDIGVVLCRQTDEEPWRVELVYSLADNSCFFRGLPPATDREIAVEMQKMGRNLPRDFRAFVRLHNGFGKLTELEILPLHEIGEARQELIDRVLKSDRILRAGEAVVDPHSLYPFYQEYDGSGQCFTSEWYPGSEMGNVYFSGIDYILSDTSDRKGWAENLAYPTFLEWLNAFLSGMNLAP